MWLHRSLKQNDLINKYSTVNKTYPIINTYNPNDIDITRRSLKAATDDIMSSSKTTFRLNKDVTDKNSSKTIAICKDTYKYKCNSAINSVRTFNQ